MMRLIDVSFSLSMPQPKVIFLDAVGTLFGVRDSVGVVYADLAQQFSVTVAPEIVDQAFAHSFRTATPMAFPDASPLDIPNREFDWWEAIARHTFDQAGVLHQFEDFSRFFKSLYSHFATATPWFVYPEVEQTLQHWRDRGIELGVLSNFDSRLYPVLEALNLAPFFDSVTISTEAGAAKPDAKIFATALQKHGCTAKEAWHIGDSRTQDYQGAKAAGLRGIWLKRSYSLAKPIPTVDPEPSGERL